MAITSKELQEKIPSGTIKNIAAVLHQMLHTRALELGK